MTNRVIIVGAGASKSYDLSPTGIRMPIATDFFRTFNKLDISANPYVRVGAIVNYFADTRKKLPEDFGNFSEDIEAFHSEIEASLAEAMQRKNRLKCIELSKVSMQLIFMFVSVINEIQNGQPSLMHKRLIESLSSEDVLVTFNWDTLLDRALDDNTDWNPDNGYLMQPTAIYDNGWRMPISDNGFSRKYPQLLKLHGSTNWLTSYTVLDRDYHVTFTHDTRPEDFFVYRHTNEPYDCYDGRYMEGYQPYSYGYYPPNLTVQGKPVEKGHVIISVTPRGGPFVPRGKAGDAGLVSMPLIIPPTAHKRYDFFGGLFKGLWQEAENRLMEAEEIHVYGYSFPETDTQSQKLFLNAFSKRHTLPKVVIVNPSPESVARRLEMVQFFQIVT